MVIHEFPDYPDENLQLLYSYHQQIKAILEELKEIPTIPYSLMQKLSGLQTKIEIDINCYISQGQKEAPAESTDF